MTTEATGNGADDFDLAASFEELDPVEEIGTPELENGGQAATSTQNDEVELDENGDPIVHETEEVPELEVELDEDGNPVEKPAAVELKDDTKLTLTIDGKPVEYTLGALKANAQKYEAANKRFEEAAQIRKDAESKLAVLPEREKQLGQVLEYYIGQAQTFLQAEQPDWAKLLEEDPHGYLKERQKWETKQAELNQAKNIQTELQRRNAEAQAASQAQRAAEEKEKLFTALPEWKDPVKAAEGAKAVDAYLEQQGLAPEMRAQIDTATVFLIARKAMLYDAAVAKQAAARAAGTNRQAKPAGSGQQQTQVVRPSAGKVVAPQARTATAQKRAAATKAFNSAPSVDTLAGLFMD